MSGHGIKILPANEVRTRFTTVLGSLRKEQATYFVTKNGRAVAALLPMEIYEQMMSDLEDRLDETDESLARDVEAARAEFKAGRSKPWRKSR